MTNNDKVRDLVTELRYGYALNEAADLIEKLTGEPSEAMSESGLQASRYCVTGHAATNLSYKAMIEQGIKEVLGDG